MSDSPKIFISYSWDSEEHRSWVKKLADRLILNGVNVILDQYDAGPGADFIHFMEQAVEQSDRVISILTTEYKTRSDERKRGVGYESVLTTWQFYDRGIEERFILPVVRSGDFSAVIPNYLRSIVALDFRDDAKFEDNFMSLLKAIYNHSDRPELGRRPDFVNSPAPSSSASTRPTNNENATSDNPFQTIKKLLINADFDNAIKQMLELASTGKYSDYENTVIMQASRWNGLKRNINSGIIASENATLQTNRIRNALLSLLKEMSEE